LPIDGRAEGGRKREFLGHQVSIPTEGVRPMDISEEALELMRQFMKEVAASNLRQAELAKAILAAFPPTNPKLK
jgi:hypothetical protein